MRKVFSVALMTAMLAMVGMTRDAGATVTISLVWETCTGGCIGLGTDTIEVAAGPQTARLGIILTHNDPDTLSIHAFSLNYDTALENELNVNTAMAQTNEWGGSDTDPGGASQLYAPLTGGLSGFVESTGVLAGRVNTYESGALGPGLPANGLLYSVGTASATAPATYRVGFVTFVINGALTDGADIFSGAFNTGVDGIFDGLNNDLVLGGQVNFGTATVNAPIPEPGTVSLLGLGLVGLVVAGRRNRR
jgi:hypothetical protein